MTDSLSHLATALAGRYKVERELGAGGMATVYLARDLRHDRKVALKVLRPELSAILGAERFLQEIKTTANLQHPHILPLHDSGEADGVVFYVMPYIEGESLRDRLKREHQLPIDDALRIATEVAGALDYAHRHGVIHRDIKPENILLNDGSALVADFGIALAVSRSEGGTRMTETGMSLGTPHYMSPEQAMGEREITAKSDVYALGCVTYEMLAGEPPFNGPTAQAIIARVMTEEPRSLTLQRRTIPPHVEEAVQTALAKLPADRFATPAQFAEALAGHGPVMRTTRSALAPARVAVGARWPLLVTAGVAVVGLALAAWGWLRVRADSRRPASWHYVSLGDSVALATTAPSFALSPDGTTLVFKDSRLNGTLSIKRGRDLNAIPLPGTERASNPTFSPDGKWIAYVADGHVKKVQTAGGPPVTISDSALAGFGGVAWLDDGTLVYPAATLNMMRRVSENGGPSTVILHDTTGTMVGGGIGMPVPLPGARGVLFQYCGSGCVTMAIWVLDLHTGKAKHLLDDVAQASYLPDGRLLYVRRDGGALIAPFNLKTLEITGPPVPVLEGVDVNGTSGFALLAWSQAGTLMYIGGAGSGAEDQMVRVSRTGAVTPIDSSWHGQFNSLALSPDGKRLAVGLGSSGGLNIWVKQLDKGPVTRLTFGGEDRRPTWSPDGRMVAFIRDTTGSNAFSAGGNSNSVYARPADGSGSDRFLARLDRPVQEVEWSHDGHWLLLRTDNGTRGAGDIVGVRVGGDTTPVPFLAGPYSELHPALSPDSHWLAYASDESGQSEVYVRPFPNTTGGRWQVSNGGGSEPRWARDGHEIYFLDGASRLVAAQVRTTPTFTILGSQPLFDASEFSLDFFHQYYDVSPDGRSFIFLRPRARARALQIVWVDHWFSDVRARLGR